MELLNVGRYISSDPIGIAGGLNTFGYVGQNPVNAIDPLGLKFIDVNSGVGDPATKDEIIEEAYNRLKCSALGDWFRKQLRKDNQTLEDMFFTNVVSFNFGYYPHSFWEDNTFFTANGGAGHTNWEPRFLPQYGFPGQPDQTMGMSVRSLGWSREEAARLFIHEATQALRAKYGIMTDIYSKLDPLLDKEGSCGCSAE